MTSIARNGIRAGTFRACLVRVRVRMVLYAFSYEKALFN
jgi:hypothetical protein